MNCRNWKLEISALLDENLADDLRSGVERHIAECSACAAFYHEHAEVNRQLQEAAFDLPLPSSIWARVETTIRDKEAARSREKRFSWDFTELLRIPRWGYGLAGAAAAVFAVFMAVQTRGPSQESILAELDGFTVQAENNPFVTEVVRPENPFFSYERTGEANPFGGEEISR